VTPAPLNAALRQLCQLLDVPALGAVADGRLLELFVRRHDQAAFSVLLSRYGPLVWHVGRRVLSNAHDAEDVFQATFLLLARKAGSIRRHESVASWLHGVAYRLAVQLRKQAARRKARERRAGTTRWATRCRRPHSPGWGRPASCRASGTGTRCCRPTAGSSP